MNALEGKQLMLMMKPRGKPNGGWNSIGKVYYRRKDILLTEAMLNSRG